MRIARVLSVVISILVLAAASFAQDRKPLPRQDQQQYVISAKSGIVNFTHGDVSYKRGETEQNHVVVDDEFQTGDIVKTGADGKVEVLLMPGTYLRLAANTQFEFTNNSLDNLRLKLLKGSAIVESAMGDDWKGPLLWIATPKTEFCIIREGLYRFNVQDDGRSQAMVHKGKLTVADKEVKEGKEVTVDAGAAVIASFDKKAEDSFDLWSKDRAGMLVASTYQIQPNNANAAFLGSALGGNLGYWYGSYWYYDPFLGYYSFLPWDLGFYSPYGWGYGYCYPWYYYPPVHWTPPVLGGGGGHHHHHHQPAIGGPGGAIASVRGGPSRTPQTSGPSHGFLIGGPSRNHTMGGSTGFSGSSHSSGSVRTSAGASGFSRSSSSPSGFSHASSGSSHVSSSSSSASSSGGGGSSHHH